MKSRTESERDVYKVALDEITNKVAAVWQTGPAPKDGTKILGIFNGDPHVVSWESWEVGETIPGGGSYYEGEESGWVIDNGDVISMDENEPKLWALIILPR